MGRRWTVLVAAALLVGCGGGDAGDATDPVGATDDGRFADDTTVADPDVASGDDTGTTDDTDPTDDRADTGDDASGDAANGDRPACAELFTDDEIADWFGEPVATTDGFDDGIGHLVCTWETIEDPDDVDDLSFQLIVAQVFTGDPMPAANFVDPEIFGEVTSIDGVGDLAFYEGSLGRNYYFLDGETAGTFTYDDIDLGDVDRPKRHTADEVDELFREFHRRVMG